MAKTLITGASGFIGRALATALASNREVICMSRANPELDMPWIKGNFAAFEDLLQLDDHPIDTVVHLGAVTGGGTERDLMLANVEGSRCLMRYLAARGCRKFVLASSIAAVGMQSPHFRPLQVPIPDDHPCFDRHGYGLSKFLMEEIAKYMQRQNADLDIINLRLSSVCPDQNLPELRRVEPPRQWGLGSLTIMALSDGVRVFSLAADAPYTPGVRTMNAAGPKAWVADPVAQILRHWWGSDVDLSHFESTASQYDSVYDVDLIGRQLGFVATCLPPTP